MKVYSIGRDAGCDIVINDSTDVVSRRHALLNITPMGKMFVTDQSMNGTYVNGIKITSNIPVPVSRKDVISFAHVAQLEWKRVPRSAAWMKYLIISLVIFVTIVGAGLGYKYVSPNHKESVATVRLNTVKVKKRAIVSKKDSCKTAEKNGSEKVPDSKVSKPAKSNKSKVDKKVQSKKKKDGAKSSKKATKKTNDKKNGKSTSNSQNANHPIG
jgi:hypothetical protein